MTALTVSALAAFVKVFLSVFQSRNFTLDRDPYVLPTSILLAAVDLYIMSFIAKQGFSLTSVLVVGTSSGLGALASMHLHRRVTGKQDRPRGHKTLGAPEGSSEETP